eukprot:11758135-Ditylum_brightwellii.AAC.1
MEEWNFQLDYFDTHVKKNDLGHSRSLLSSPPPPVVPNTRTLCGIIDAWANSSSSSSSSSSKHGKVLHAIAKQYPTRRGAQMAEELLERMNDLYEHHALDLNNVTKANDDGNNKKKGEGGEGEEEDL